jgi:NitT/TauT family transport system substrate-binding protein
MMPMFRRLAPAAVALACALAACFAAPRAAAADDDVTLIGGSTPAGFFEVLEYVAERAGYFKTEHLNVTTQFAGGASAAAQLVASGHGDICALGFEPIIQGYEKGLRLTAFFSRDPRNYNVVGVLDDSPIRTLADFKGKSLGEYSPGSPAEISTNSMLYGAGLKKGDVAYIPIGSGAQAIAALTSGKVAGAAFPYQELATYEVVAHLKFRFFWHPILKDISNVGYAATPATIQTKGDILRRFARAQAKAAVFIRVNPRLAARYFLDGAGLAVTPASLDNETRVLELSQDQLPAFDPTSKRIGDISLRNWDVFTRWFAANGLTSALVPVSAVATDQFIPFANDFDHKALIAQAERLR